MLHTCLMRYVNIKIFGRKVFLYFYIVIIVHSIISKQRRLCVEECCSKRSTFFNIDLLYSQIAPSRISVILFEENCQFSSSSIHICLCRHVTVLFFSPKFVKREKLHSLYWFYDDDKRQH